MKQQKKLCLAIGLLTAFLLWTAAIQFVDVRPIGPQGSSVGFAAMNQFVHNLTGVHMSLYHITDWLGLIPLVFVLGFGLLGLVQWVKRRHLFRVDFDLLVLGGFYLAVFAAYTLFEIFVVNYRPVLIHGFLEASYPSSTTMLALCVMPTAIMQWNTRIKHKMLRRCVTAAASAFMVFLVIGRLIAGVHWFTDIVGGVLLSAGLVSLYCAAAYRQPPIPLR